MDETERYIGRRVDAPRAPAPDRPRRQRRARRNSWPLARLLRACRSAPAVWLALCELAGERSIVTPTRYVLAKATGIPREKTISAALTALEHAGWIERGHKPMFRGGRQVATLLRIALVRRGRKTPHTGARSVEGEKRPKGKGRKAPQDFTT